MRAGPARAERGAVAAARRRRRQSWSSARSWSRADQPHGDAAAAAGSRARPTRSSPADRTASAWSSSDRYLMLMAALVLLLNVVNTSGEYLFGRYVVNTADGDVRRGPGGARPRASSSSARPTAAISATSTCSDFLLQMFVVSRVFKFLGVGRALLIHPIVALIGYVGMLRAPSFEVIRVVEDRRQQPRLLARQHDQAGAVAADQPRGEIQGQTGDRLVLRPRRRRSPGRRRLHRRARVAHDPGVRGGQHRLRRRLARRRPRAETPAGSRHPTGSAAS